LDSNMDRPRNDALSEVLDAPQPPEVDMAREGMEDSGAEEGNGVDMSEELHREQQARARAEADCEDKSRRLAVATEQLAEYAGAKRTEAAGLASKAEALVEAVAGGEPAAVAAVARALQAMLGEAAAEAEAFATQARRDADRHTAAAAPAAPALEAGAAAADGAAAPPADEPMASDSPREKRAREVGDAPTTEAEHIGQTNGAKMQAQGGTRSVMSERAKWIPLRLDLKERKLLRLLEAALNVSEYVDKVDVLSYRSKTQRMHAQLKDICAILSGLLVASDYKQGQKLIQNRSFVDNASFFQDCFEVGRRHKVMNPEKMRGEYGKLVYLLMDSQLPEVQQLLEFQCVRPLRTVYAFLLEKGAAHLLDDELVPVATMEILAEGKPRALVQREIKEKERAREAVARKYARGDLSEDEIRHCMYSIGDNSSYLRFNRDPVEKMIQYLDHFFRPDKFEHGYSLAISGGMGGARLTHNHERQYRYVLQSLSLWRDISDDMFRLWCLAEEDLLKEGNFYRLTNTGQGLNRVQQASKTSSAMHNILSKCQQRLGHWVGSSVIHLGDHNVPNALMFIDKYTQVPRILNPIVLVIQGIPELMKDRQLRSYVEATFGSQEALVKEILCDFYRHGFDGSGADNFFDAGSCIDGRLTSAWNWCSKLEKKRYYHIFKLAGFSSFDGDFQK